MPTVYFHSSWGSDEALLSRLERQTPGASGNWNDLECVSDPELADFHVALNQPADHLDETKLILYSLEPPFSGLLSGWDEYDALSKNPIESTYFPQVWMVDKTYDELSEEAPPSKPSDLSWITTDKGRGMNSILHAIQKLLIRTEYRKSDKKNIPLIDRGPSDGHLLRMEFLESLVDAYPSLLDLFGRGDFEGPYYRGPVEDKWDGLADYRYSLAIENYKGPNYFSEKLTDALLAWCMPIYWGCTNLPKFLPEDSFVWLDIEDESAPEKVRDIVNSDLREQNIDAIAEARRRLLNEYQMLPTVERTIAALER